MSKYKICVYAISKNEEKFVDRWVDSIKDADAIYVLDTGSTDNTVELLKKRGVNVTSKIINPWRFDVARNEALSLVPLDFDICISLDLDEVLNSNWRNILEDNWTNDTDRIFYNYNAESLRYCRTPQDRHLRGRPRRCRTRAPPEHIAGRIYPFEQPARCAPNHLCRSATIRVRNIRFAYLRRSTRCTTDRCNCRTWGLRTARRFYRDRRREYG